MAGTSPAMTRVDQLSISLRSSNRFARCYQQTKSQQIVVPHSFLLLESAARASYSQRRSTAVLAFLHVGTATESVRQYRRRWLVLIERRQQNFVELCNSGRWRRYYTQAQFLEEMRKVLQLRNQWAQLAGLPLSEQIEFQKIDLQQIGFQPLDLKQTELQQKDLKPIKLQPDTKQSDRQSPSVQHVNPTSPSAVGPRRRPASAILAAVAGRL